MWVVAADALRLRCIWQGWELRSLLRSGPVHGEIQSVQASNLTPRHLPKDARNNNGYYFGLRGTTE